MGLISRVSSRTYRNYHLSMADILVVGRPVTAGPRTRPEAVEIADKHAGRQMAQNLHDYNNKAFATRNFDTRELKKSTKYRTVSFRWWDFFFRSSVILIYSTSSETRSLIHSQEKSWNADPN